MSDELSRAFDRMKRLTPWWRRPWVWWAQFRVWRIQRRIRRLARLFGEPLAWAPASREPALREAGAVAPLRRPPGCLSCVALNGGMCSYLRDNQDDEITRNVRRWLDATDHPWITPGCPAWIDEFPYREKK